MPLKGIVEEDEEGDLVVVLKESKESMTASEREEMIKRFERNMCPVDYENQHGESH
jgi:hypothetical protein